MEQTTEPMLSPKEVSALLDVSERTLHTWRVRGDGPTWVRIGANGRIRYHRASVLSFCVSGQVCTG